MRVSKSQEEIWRIKEKISAEISGMSHEEIIRYFQEKRPEWIGTLRQYEKTRMETASTEKKSA